MKWYHNFQMLLSHNITLWANIQQGTLCIKTTKKLCKDKLLIITLNKHTFTIFFFQVIFHTVLKIQSIR